jgi:hypothetical protein
MKNTFMKKPGLQKTKAPGLEQLEQMQPKARPGFADQKANFVQDLLPVTKGLLWCPEGFDMKTPVHPTITGEDNVILWVAMTIETSGTAVDLVVVPGCETRLRTRFNAGLLIFFGRNGRIRGTIPSLSDMRDDQGREGSEDSCCLSNLKIWKNSEKTCQKMFSS